MMVRRYVVGTLDLSADAADEQERQIHDEYREWRRASLEDWLDGVPGTPEPPFVGVLDTGFARLA
jgi:hypothetical protein